MPSGSFHGIATALALGCSVAGIFCLVSPDWVNQNLAFNTNGNFESGKIEYGLMSMCFDIPAQARTGNINFGSCPQFYGKDLGRDWPSKLWAAAVVLMGVSVVFCAVVSVCGVVDFFTISSFDIFCSLSIAFAAICHVLVVSFFIGGLGGVAGIEGVGEIEICSAAKVFSSSKNCQLGWTAYLAIVTMAGSIIAAALFGQSGRAASGSGAYA